MSRTRIFTSDRIFVMACSVAIATGIVAIAGMCLAGVAFSNATTITIPWIATFDGFRDESGSPAVTITASWQAAAVVTLALAAALWVVMLRRHDHPA